MKRLLCKIGWHSIFVGFIHLKYYAKCKWCGYKGLIDSTGALF